MAKAAKKSAQTGSGKGGSKSQKASPKTQKGSGKHSSRANRTPQTLVTSSVADLSIAQRVSWYSLLAMVFIVPIIMSNWTWLGFQLPVSYDQFDIIKVFFQRVLGLLALAAWGWHMLTKGGKIRHTPVDWLILAFLAWVTVSMLFSIHPATAFFGKYRRFEGLLSFINYAVIYFLVLQFADRPSRMRTLAETLFWSSTLVAGYGLMQSLGRDMINWHSLPFEVNRPFSTYGNPDLLGGFLMFSVPLALALALAEDNKWVRLIYWAGFGINAYVWIVAFTRGAWIGGAVGIALMIVVAWRHSCKLTTWDWVPAGVIVAGGAGAIVKSMSAANEVMNFGKRFASIIEFDKGSGLTRTEIWSAAIDSITYSPLRFVFGWGADTFRLVFPKFKPIEYTRDAGYLSVADNVHNYPLQLASGIGVVGVCLLYAIFIWAAVRSFKTAFGASTDADRILFGGFWVACAAYLTQLMFGLSVTGNTFLLWTFIGIVLAPGAATVEFKAPEWGVIAAVCLCALAAAGFVHQNVLMAADYAYLRAQPNLGLEGAARTKSAQQAVALNPFNDMYRAEVGMSLRQEMLDAANAMYQAQQQGADTSKYGPIVVEKFNAATASLKETIAFVPYEYDNYVFITSVYNLASAMLDKKYSTDAMYWGKKGIELEPFGPAIRVEYAKALMNAGRSKEALDMLWSAWRMDNGHAEAGALIAQQLITQGKQSEALDVLKKTDAKLAVKDPNVTQLLNQLEASSTPATTVPVGKK